MENPFSLFLELNVLLYAGVLAFVAGLGWTVSTWSQQLGYVLVLTVLSTIIAACFWYCFSRAPAWSLAETTTPSPIFDYVLYLGSLSWSVELAYLEKRNVESHVGLPKRRAIWTSTTSIATPLERRDSARPQTPD